MAIVNNSGLSSCKYLPCCYPVLDFVSKFYLFDGMRLDFQLGEEPYKMVKARPKKVRSVSVDSIILANFRTYPLLVTLYM